nr:hypothetical protein [Sulfurovaceae bacterium]
VRHKNELNPKVLGEIILKNPSNQEEQSRFFGKGIIKKYIRELEESDNRLSNHLNQLNIKTIKINSNDNILDRLVKSI